MIYESDDVIDYLDARNLRRQYIKACIQATSWGSGWLDFKQRQPRSDEVRSFRITQKYRAYGRREWDNFVVTAINDHQ